MQNWEYNYLHIPIHPGAPVNETLERKYSDGSTILDLLNRYGNEGWELVDVFPDRSGGYAAGFTTGLLYTFKRPIQGAD